MKFRFLALITIVLACTVAQGVEVSEPPFLINPTDPIKVGMSVSLTGENAEIGEDIRQGVETYFNKINAAGGVQGHSIQLIVMDDNYDPQRAAQNVRQMIDKDGVIAIIGNNGTATAMAVVPVVNQTKVLLFGAYGGAEVLRKNPPDRYVINLRASYAEEMQLIMQGLIGAGIRPEEFAFMLQDDAFGDSIYAASLAALREAGYASPESLPNGRYPRNTVAVEDAFAKIVNSSIKPPRVIIMAGTLAANSKFLKIASKAFPETYFFAFAGFVNASELTSDNNGKVLMSEVVPYFKSDNIPAMQEYLDDLKKYGNSAAPSIISFQDYLTAKLFVIGLNQAAANNQLTREGLIDAFESLRDVDIGIGVLISFDKADHQALVITWPSIYRNGEFVPLNLLDLPRY